MHLKYWLLFSTHKVSLYMRELRENLNNTELVLICNVPQCIIVQFIARGPKQWNVSVILSHGQLLGWTKIVLKNLHQELGELLIYKRSPLILIIVNIITPNINVSLSLDYDDGSDSSGSTIFTVPVKSKYLTKLLFIKCGLCLVDGKSIVISLVHQLYQ